MPEIIHIAIAVIGLLLFAKLIGYLLLKVITPNDFLHHSVFIQIAAGICFVAMGYAVYSTRLHTLYLPPFSLLLFYFIFRSTSRIKLIKFSEAVSGVYELIFSSLAFTLLFVFFNNPFSSKVYIIGHDYAYYSYLSYYLSYYGIENALGIFNFQEYYAQINKIYHYLELWLIAFVADIFKLHNLIVAHAVMAIISMVTVFVFISEILKKIKAYQKLVLLLLIPTTFLVLPFFKDIPLLNSTFNLGNQSFWIFPKYFFILIILLTYIKLYTAKVKYAVAVFLFLPFAHTGTTFLGAFILLMLFALEVLMSNSSGVMKKAMNYVFPGYFNINRTSLSSYELRFLGLKISETAFVAGTVLVIYVIIAFAMLKYYSANDKYTENIFNYGEIFSISYILLITKIIAKTIIDSVIVTAPFVVVFLFFRKQLSNLHTHIPLYLIIVFLISGLVSYAAFNYVTNEAAQFYYYIFFTILPVFFIYTLMNLWVHATTNRFFIVVLLFFCGYSIYSFYFSQLSFNNKFVERSFINNISENFEKNNSLHKPGAVFYNSNFVNPRLLRITQGYELLGMAYPGAFYIRFSKLPDLSTLTDILRRDIMAHEAMTNPYSVYCRLNQLEKDYKPESVIAAMKNFNVNWVVEDENSYVPDYLLPYVDYVLHDTMRAKKIHFLVWDHN